MKTVKNPKVAVIMGSDSDFNIVKETIILLKKFNVEVDINIISAHRSPEKAAQYAKEAESNEIDVIIAAAGKAAHLAGVMAAFTILPVIGLPIKSSMMDGLDSLLSIVQMPKGIPVATVAINGAENAAILAVQILSIAYSDLKEKLIKFKKEMAEEVEQKNKALKGMVEK